MVIYLIGRHKFGSNIDYFNWFNLLKKQGYKINYLCVGIIEGYNSNEDVKIFEGQWNRQGIIKFTKWCSSIIRSSNNNSLVIVKAFQGMSLLRFFLFFNQKAKLVSDIRSQSVSEKNRSLLNFLMFLESKFFHFKTAINKNVGQKIFKSNLFSIIPLGADSLFLNAKRFKKSESINFLYVGTFYRRNIIEFVNAFLCSKTTYRKKLTIIGGNDSYVENKLKEISELHSDQIEYVGYIPNIELVDHFENTDIGISWVPLKDFYDWQPPTKIIEYLMAGIPVLATNTSASRELVDNSVGWLIRDTYQEVVDFLESLNVENIPSYQVCREKVKSRTWENVVNEQLIPFLNKVKNNKL
jgi:glycosyltransferase involved in cell wall biosynthesis